MAEGGVFRFPRRVGVVATVEGVSFGDTGTAIGDGWLTGWEGDRPQIGAAGVVRQQALTVAIQTVEMFQRVHQLTAPIAALHVHLHRALADELKNNPRPLGGGPGAIPPVVTVAFDDAPRDKAITFSQYVGAVRRTAADGVDNDPNVTLTHWALGLAGEAGEVIELVKKQAFTGQPFDQNRMAEELGDVLWYLTALAWSVGIDLDDVAKRNVQKLEKRYPAGFVLGGGNRG